MVTSGKYRAFVSPPRPPLPRIFISQGSVLAPRLCPVEGKEGERGEKKFPPYCSAAGKLLSSVLPFICRVEKNVEKFGEINLNTGLGTLTFPLCPLHPCTLLPGFLFPLPLWVLGLRWAWTGAELGLGWGCSGTGTGLRLYWAEAVAGLGLIWAWNWAGTGAGTRLSWG